MLSFLHGMYTKSCLYSGLCGASSALSSAVCIKGFSKLSDHPTISRYLKGSFNRHPPLPKYEQIWDINQVLDYDTSSPDNKELECKYIVKKLVMLFLILGARRKQARFTINIENVTFADNKVILLPNKTLEHTNPNRPLEPLTYHKYDTEEKLCIVNCLQSYLEKRNQLVNDEVRELLITYGKPHKPVSRDSAGRWIKNELTNAGVYTVFQHQLYWKKGVGRGRVLLKNFVIKT